MFAFKHWFIQLFIAVDQLLNVLITPFSKSAWADETLSCRAYRMYEKGKLWGLIWMPLIDALFFWQGKGHCKRAYENEMKRYNMPPEMRE